MARIEVDEEGGELPTVIDRDLESRLGREEEEEEFEGQL